MNKKKHKFNNIYRAIVNRVRLYKDRSTVQGQTITGNTRNGMNTMMTEAFDVETDFARQFDLQIFVSDGKTGQRKVCIICIQTYFCRHSYADRQTHFAQ